MIYDPYSIINQKYVYIKNKNNEYKQRYKANYLKQFSKKTIIVKDGYLFYY